jgi:hypothetical protein
VSPALKIATTSAMVVMTQPMRVVGRIATCSTLTTAYDTELYLKHCILRWVFVRQSGAVPKQVARADASDVQGDDQPPCRVCEG